MEPILVDTSVWIDWFKGVGTPQTNRIATYLMADYPIWIAPVILQETLQGVREDVQYELVRSSLLALEQFQADPFDMAIAAATTYRTLRKQGITIRKANDCLIAQYALMSGMTLLHNDTDFELIASKTALRVSRL
ncbi:PIN domain nuclease [Fibrella sp. WM1]|uniref:type II toxin-antitoxin system VapC family toxin n=1 Tax=Fibrella musci TaxID=3242485 RepID=UPI0035220D3D